MAQKILVVDDDRQIARLVSSYLQQAGYDVDTAYDGESALAQVHRYRPDLLILDLMLPDRDGWDVTRAIRADQSVADLPVIMLTARVEDTDRIVGLELGADDYVTKPFNPREVVARVRAVLRRASGGAAPTHILRAGGLVMDIDRHEVTVEGRPVELTPTEFGLLRVLMENPGHALSRALLMEKGLGFSYDTMERTVDSHIKNLRRKIEPDPTHPTYIQSVFGVGYRLKAE
ncbi:MAG TPA: response regulator transcription factor [Chloroflexia bacterium]|nr:response regulator transcription factor [Chloroflexia bacterium]